MAWGLLCVKLPEKRFEFEPTMEGGAESVNMLEMIFFHCLMFILYPSFHLHLKGFLHTHTHTPGYVCVALLSGNVWLCIVILLRMR